MKSIFPLVAVVIAFLSFSHESKAAGFCGTVESLETTFIPGHVADDETSANQGGMPYEPARSVVMVKLTGRTGAKTLELSEQTSPRKIELVTAAFISKATVCEDDANLSSLTVRH